MTTETNSVSLMAKIAAEVALGKIRLNPYQGEPQYLQPVRLVMMQFKKAIGVDGFAALSEELRPAVHAFADLIFDEVAGVSPREKTIEKLKALPMPERLAVENMAAKLTGKLDPRDHHWMDELWEAKRYVERVATLSISGITTEDIREGFDPVVHKLVDAIYDRRATLVN